MAINTDQQDLPRFDGLHCITNNSKSDNAC